MPVSSQPTLLTEGLWEPICAWGHLIVEVIVRAWFGTSTVVPILSFCHCSSQIYHPTFLHTITVRLVSKGIKLCSVVHIFGSLYAWTCGTWVVIEPTIGATRLEMEAFLSCCLILACTAWKSSRVERVFFPPAILPSDSFLGFDSWLPRMW